MNLFKAFSRPRASMASNAHPRRKRWDRNGRSVHKRPEDLDGEGAVTNTAGRSFRVCYVGGCSSPCSQPVAVPLLNGSGRSHSSQRYDRGPSPPGARAARIGRPQLGHLGEPGKVLIREFWT